MITALISLALGVLLYFLTPTNKPPKAGKLDQFSIPSVDPGKKKQVVFGKTLVKDYFVSWYGSLEVGKHNKTIMGKKTFLNYKYALTMIHKLCLSGIEKMTKICIADNIDKQILWTGTITDNISQNVQDPGLFGGKERGGGWEGKFYVGFGGENQERLDFLSTKIDTNYPALRNEFTVTWKDTYIGTQQNVKNLWYEVERYTKQAGLQQDIWYPSKAKTSTGMNPAHILYEMTTNPYVGAGISSGKINDTMMTTTADTLFNEGFGLNFVFNANDSSVTDVIKIIESATNGFYYEDPTGICFKLARDDYDIATIPSFTESDVIKISNFTTPSQGAANKIVLSYTNPDDYAKETITVKDDTMFRYQGQWVVENIDMPFITNKELASKIATRELKQAVSRLRSFTLDAMSTMGDLKPGDVFKFTYPEYKVQDVVFRVISIAKGDFADKKVNITAMEDIFSLGEGVYLPANNEWEDPITNIASSPHNITDYNFMWTPYYLVQNRIKPNNIELFDNNITDTDEFLLLNTVNPITDGMEYDLYNNGTLEGAKSFSLNGTLIGNIDYNQTTINVDMQDEDPSLLKSVICVNDELMSIESYNGVTGDLVVKRAILDTVPTSHASGSDIYFAEESDAYGYSPYKGSSNFQCLIRTLISELKMVDATTYNLLYNNRQNKPYPPAKIAADGNERDSSNVIARNFTGTETVFSWANRDRLNQLSNGFLSQSDATITPEAGTTNSIMLYDKDDILKKTVTGLTGTVYNYSKIDEAADFGSEQEIIKAKFRSVRDGLNSYQDQEVEVVTGVKQNIVAPLHDNTANTTVINKAGSNGTANRNTSLLSVTGPKGNTNTAFDFDHSINDKLTFTNNNSINGKFTFNAWLKLEMVSGDTGNSKRCIFKGYTGPDIDIFYESYSDIRLNFWLHQYSPYERFDMVRFSLPRSEVTEWFMFTATANSGEKIKVYINGILKEEDSNNNTYARISEGDTMRIGAGSGFLNYNGSMANVRVSNTVFSPELITEIYDLEKWTGVVNAPLIAVGASDITLTQDQGFDTYYTITDDDTEPADPTAGTGVLYSTPIALTDPYWIRSAAQNLGIWSSIVFDKSSGGVLPTPIASYNFNNNINDQSGNGYHMTQSGGVSYSGTSILLDGVDGYLQAMIPYNTNRTYSIWVTTTELAKTMSLLFFTNSTLGVPDTSDALYIDNDDVSIYAWDGAAKSTTTTNVLSSGVQVNIIATMENNDSMNIYINGVFKVTVNIGTRWSSGDRILLGKNSTSIPTDYFDGLVDSLDIYNLIPTPTDITNIYNAGPN